MKNKNKTNKKVVEDGYEFFAKRQLVTLFSAPNYCGEFDNAGGMMSVDETLMCSFQILKPSEKKAKYQYGGMNAGRPVTPPRTAALTTTGLGGMTTSSMSGAGAQSSTSSAPNSAGKAKK